MISIDQGLLLKGEKLQQSFDHKDLIPLFNLWLILRVTGCRPAITLTYNKEQGIQEARLRRAGCISVWFFSQRLEAINAGVKVVRSAT